MGLGVGVGVAFALILLSEVSVCGGSRLFSFLAEGGRGSLLSSAPPKPDGKRTPIQRTTFSRTKDGFFLQGKMKINFFRSPRPLRLFSDSSP